MGQIKSPCKSGMLAFHDEMQVLCHLRLARPLVRPVTVGVELQVLRQLDFGDLLAQTAVDPPDMGQNRRYRTVKPLVDRRTDIGTLALRAVSITCAAIRSRPVAMM